MTLYQFNALEGDEHFQMLWEKGVHISQREDEGYRLLLYQIDGFYELKYEPTINKIDGQRSFLSVNQLDSYLEQIQIPKLQ